MKASVRQFAMDESGAVLPAHSLMIAGVICVGLALIISRVGKQLSTLLKLMAERRRRRSASEQVLARGCAVIDLLIRSGYGEAHAIKAVATRMQATDILSPDKADDVQDWKWLERWRDNLLGGRASEAACAEYRLCARQLEGTPARTTIDEELWDRRHVRQQISAYDNPVRSKFDMAKGRPG